MKRTIALAAILSIAVPAQAQEPSLKVGDAAPPLQIAKWVKGNPVAAYAPGQIYVVEFWATWCGPCIASMPHLTELQARYRPEGLTVVAVSSKDRANNLEKVEAMVKDKGEGMGYTVAWDDDRKTNTAYMRAAAQSGIPCSFLVDRAGRIAYIGHPMWLDIPLREVIAGTWDPAAGQKKIDATQKKLEAVYRTARDTPVEAVAQLEELVAEVPTLASLVGDMHFQLLMDAGQTGKAYVVAARIVEVAIAQKDPMKLNEIAWTIVDPDKEITPRDLDLALRAAAKAVELTRETDGAILDTLARVHFWKKDLNRALEIQRKAVAVDPSEGMKKTLAEYEKAIKGNGSPNDQNRSGDLR